MLHCGWRGLAAGIVARGAAVVERAPRRDRPRDRPLLLRGRPRGARRLRRPRRGDRRRGAMLDLPEVARRALARAGVERVESAGLCTFCEAGLFFSHRRDARRHRPAGQPGSPGSSPSGAPSDGAQLFHDIDPARVRANLERGARASPRAGVEVLVACKYVPLEEMGALAEAGVTLVGENRQQDLAAKHERWGERLHLGLHRQPAEPQGQADPAAGAAGPLGRHRLGAGPARQARHRRDRGPDRGQRRRRGGEGGGRARRRSAEFIARCPVRVGGLMTMPPFSRGPGGLAAAFRPPGRAGRRQRSRLASRWGPRRTGGSRSRRGRRSSVWDRAVRVNRR